MEDASEGLGWITPAWLTRVLHAAGALPEGRVAGRELEPAGTFTDEVWRLRLRYQGAPEGAPSSLVLKRPRPGSRPRPAESFGLEVRFYRELAGRLPARTPRLYHGVAGATGTALLLLEDVAGLAPFDFAAGAGLEHARLALAELAKLHAAGWERAGGLDWVPDFADPALRAAFGAAYDRVWPRLRAPLSALVPAFAPIGDALVGRVARTLAPLAFPSTLLHGDAHGENIPLVEEPGGGRGVVLLDWQGPRRGSPGLDVAFFLAMSLPIETRRRLERGLVAEHAGALRRAGVRPGRDPWLDYRLGILRRAVRIIENHDSSRASGEEAVRSFRLVFERCLSAAADLDALELVRTPPAPVLP